MVFVDHSVYYFIYLRFILDRIYLNSVFSTMDASNFYGRNAKANAAGDDENDSSTDSDFSDESESEFILKPRHY